MPHRDPSLVLAWMDANPGVALDQQSYDTLHNLAVVARHIVPLPTLACWAFWARFDEPQPQDCTQ